MSVHLIQNVNVDANQQTTRMPRITQQRNSDNNARTRNKYTPQRTSQHNIEPRIQNRSQNCRSAWTHERGKYATAWQTGSNMGCSLFATGWQKGPLGPNMPLSGIFCSPRTPNMPLSGEMWPARIPEALHVLIVFVVYNCFSQQHLCSGSSFLPSLNVNYLPLRGKLGPWGAHYLPLGGKKDPWTPICH